MQNKQPIGETIPTYPQFPGLEAGGSYLRGVGITEPIHSVSSDPHPRRCGDKQERCIWAQFGVKVQSAGNGDLGC